MRDRRYCNTRASSSSVSSMAHGKRLKCFAASRATEKSRGNTERVTKAATYLANGMTWVETKKSHDEKLCSTGQPCARRGVAEVAKGKRVGKSQNRW